MRDSMDRCDKLTSDSRPGMGSRYLVFRTTMSRRARFEDVLRGAAAAVVLMLLATFAAACATTYIPNTDVPDTEDNRKVILFCEQYRHAVEEKNVAQLLKLASTNYHKRGAIDDDVDYSTLKDFLTTTFQATDAIRYEIRYRRVTLTETNHIYVDYTYAAAWKLPGVKGDEWHHQVADNRLDLVRDGESYKIVSGM